MMNTSGMTPTMTDGTEPVEKSVMNVRNYQQEMYEESLKRNIIVAMDTGSGKTHVAIMRIQYELQNQESAGKLSWFLAPNITLVDQQRDFLEQYLPPESVQFITGNHGVKTWSTQQIWDQALSRPVIATTPQVLYDALCHGFVNIHRISLLVFDEAHHCRSNHVYNCIMQEFYHPAQFQGINVPAILGLSASPIIKTQTDLDVIEKNLDAIARTPLLHRETLMVHVHKPKLKMVDYNPDDDFIELPPPPLPHPPPQPTPLLSPQASGLSSSGPKRDQLPPPSSIPAKKKKGNSWLDHFDDDLVSSVIQPASKASTSQPSALQTTSNFTPASENDDYEVLVVDIDEEDATPAYPAASSEANPLIIPATSLAPLIQRNEEESYETFTIDESWNLIPLTAASLQTTSIRSRRSSPVFDSLLAAYETMDIMKDPYVVELEKQNSSKLYKTISTKKTDSQQHMKRLINSARHVLEECGPWAVEWFILEVVTKFLSRDVSELEDFVGEFEDEETGFWRTEAEMLYLRDCLQNIKLPKKKCDIETHVSAKVMKLIDVLLDEYKAEASREEFSGLVFVNQRVAVAAVAQIIREHPKTRETFKVGTVVGSSDGGGKKVRLIQDVVSSKRNNSLAKFREGELNLLVATSVIQEGVDIPDCHLVTCFDLPKILVEYVQRRGRARRSASSFVLMYPVNENHCIEEFEKIEKEMIQHYMDPSRELAPEDSTSAEIADMRMNRTIRIPETGAMFNLGNVIPHLEHFCACLPQHEFVDTRPIYQSSKNIAPDGDPCWSASIKLPNTVDIKVRHANSIQLWRTEKWAKQDAAFEAFKALYEHKLVNDNLMPLHKYFNVQEDMIFKRPPKMAVPERLDPWQLVDKKWDEGSLFLMDINVDFDSGENVGVQMLLPMEVSEIEDLELYWTLDEKARVKFGPCQKVDKDQSTIMARARKASYTLFKSMYSRKMHEDEKRYEFAYMFVPRPGEKWDECSPTRIEALEAVGKDNEDIGLVRDNNGTPYIFRRFRHELSILEAEDFKGSTSRNLKGVKQDQPLLEVQKLSKRRDFLHPEALNRGKVGESKSLLFLPEFLFFDTLPWRYSQLALFVPFLVDRVGKAILAADLKQTLQFKGIPEHLIVQAVTASSVRDPKDYQRLEFLGDSVLKVLTSIALVDEFPLYHEGYLSGHKDKVVSNTTLAEKSKENGMSKWINTAPFTALKWAPHYRHQDPTSSTPKKLSTKVLADVIESLIGAAYLSSGFAAATEVLKTFKLSSLQFPWHPLEHRITSLISTAATNASQYSRRYPSYFSDLEKIIGYTFRNRALLLEAITHVSYGGDSTNTSYQRLEFLGDSILDMLIVQTLYTSPGSTLSQIQMHHLKSISVNAHLLAFLCLSTGTHIDQFEPDPHLRQVVTKSKWFPLHQFLRHHHADLALSQRLTLKRYHQLYPTIRRKLDEASEYPWEELHALDAPKHLSDMIESILGAIWIDSNGCFDTALGFVERIGVLNVLRRCVKEKVEVNHPLSRFGIMAAEGGRMRSVRYDVEMLREGEWECKLSVEGEVVVEMKGVSRAHVKTRAARRGLSVLREMDEAKAKEGAKKEEEEKKESEGDEKVNTFDDDDEEEEEMVIKGGKLISVQDKFRAAVETSQLATLVRLDELKVDIDDVENRSEAVVDKDEGVALGP
ncbi:P-loop containing nucleoside triphosphate hydrolase protein [Ascodesmis nigricans]|uniref:P-loop containing nucleoside triphosphate hydrolase protein n=1 Tax=Ascodesmis nigricans TaxID=341454 RepID=A0A4S2MMT6_9PEZI|nr:P-loop containing nucleoside triphosphate hydrolase protein [Ascodesmis nigricans]